MDTRPQIDPVSSARLLISLNLAIDEIKQIKSIKNSSALIKQLENRESFLAQTAFLKEKNIEFRN